MGKQGRGESPVRPFSRKDGTPAIRPACRLASTVPPVVRRERGSVRDAGGGMGIKRCGVPIEVSGVNVPIEVSGGDAAWSRLWNGTRRAQRVRVQWNRLDHAAENFAGGGISCCRRRSAVLVTLWFQGCCGAGRGRQVSRIVVAWPGHGHRAGGQFRKAQEADPDAGVAACRRPVAAPGWACRPGPTAGAAGGSAGSGGRSSRTSPGPRPAVPRRTRPPPAWPMAAARADAHWRRWPGSGESGR